MTRYHYIKKLMYLQYRLLMLPNTIHSCYGHYDTSYAKWNSICVFMRDYDERLEDLK